MNTDRVYTCVIEYFATGEGFHVYIGVVRASGRMQAIRLFRDHFKFFNNPRGWNYFKKGMVVKSGLDKSVLNNYLSPSLISHIERTPSFENMFFELNFHSTL